MGDVCSLCGKRAMLYEVDVDRMDEEETYAKRMRRMRGIEFMELGFLDEEAAIQASYQENLE